MQYVFFYFISSFVANMANILINGNYFKKSKCDFCDKVISVWRLIPILSGFFKTTCCKKKIVSYAIKELLIFTISIVLSSFSFKYVITFYFLYILSDFDIQTYEIHYPLFFIFLILQFMFFPIINICFILFLLLVFTFFDKLGFADVVFIITTSLFIHNIALYILISCIIGLMHMKLKGSNKIPFLPSLCLSYLILLILERI